MGSETIITQSADQASCKAPLLDPAECLVKQASRVSFESGQRSVFVNQRVPCDEPAAASHLVLASVQVEVSHLDAAGGEGVIAHLHMCTVTGHGVGQRTQRWLLL